ncbi:uncharacterized protein [Tenebrio molitor]|uniref:uncharacterized protein isoform X3 n=1 Tax=Tenebrio molitor TaxID=7067 RepID=UPI0036247FC8
MSYGYVPQYVTEEQELSESDCPSDGQMMQHVTSDVTELYRRKHQAVNHTRNSAGTYYHTHMPGSYYEQHSRLPTTCACNLPPDPRYCYYKAVPQNQEGMFRSSTHITPNLRTCPDTKAASAATIKKYSVTAKTPRYYRCAPTQLCKRPSTLCLPVTCQPDPAMFHRPRKAPTEIHHYRGQEAAYAINDYVMRTTAVKRTDTRPVDSEGDVNSRLNDLENLLTKFEDEDDVEGEQLEISGVSDISKILKPKVPASVKAKQDKILKLRAVKTNVTETVATTENVNKLEVKEAPEEPLEILLQRLNKENVKRKDEKHDDTNENKEGLQTKPEIGSRHQRQSVYLEQKPPLDDNSALELHKSKSYIVSLIDKALSKELGTVPGDKCSRKEFLSMNPKKAIDLVNRHISPKIYDRTMSLDLTTPASTSKKDEQQCVCKNEEPLYLKQLKQLRWSHLRHIQREAKRLADLERFLDSFSEVDSPP